MPELPEVETIRRGLANKIVGKTIEKIKIRCKRIVLLPPPREWSSALRNQNIKHISRRGKFLLLSTIDYQLLVHLGMTGQLTYWNKDKHNDKKFFIDPLTGLQKAQQHAVDKHTHISLYFSDGNALHYRDIRQFGKWRLYLVDDFKHANEYWNLGMEPLTSQYRWTHFYEKLKKRNTKIKSLLLNQQFVAGLGNIYTDEALFEAGVRPVRRTISLSKIEKTRLFEAIPKVLERGLKYGGTSFQNYLNVNGETGNNQEHLRVYGRSGKTCWQCQEQIVRILVCQRSSHFCPHCQR